MKVSKYADDTTLISPQKVDICITAEFSNLVSWSQCNKLTINLSKTKELVFCKPSVITMGDQRHEHCAFSDNLPTC